MSWRRRTAMTPALTKRVPLRDRQVHRIPKAQTRKQHRSPVTREPSLGSCVVTVAAMHRKEVQAAARIIRETARSIVQTILRHRCNRVVQHPRLRPQAAMLPEPEATEETVGRVRIKTEAQPALREAIRRTMNRKPVQAVAPIRRALLPLPAPLLQLPVMPVVATILQTTPEPALPRIINPTAPPLLQHLRKQPFIPGNERSKPARINQ